MNKIFHSFSVKEILEFLSQENYFAFFDNALCDEENHISIVFYGLLEKRESKNALSFLKDLQWAEKMQKMKHYVVCLFPYESGFSIETIFKYKKEFPMPAFFLVFNNTIVFDHTTGKLSGKIPEKKIKDLNFDWKMKKLWYDTPYSEYKKNIQKIKEYIEKGDTYQVNYTIRCKFNFSGSVYGMYLDLRERQKVPYSAFIRNNETFILSFSPELFFRKNGNLIKVRPMKGTIKRGKNPVQDKKYEEELRESIKNKAENLMIVDMMRNDLGRICVYGSVVTEPLFHIERYETLFQMTSTVKGILKRNTGFSKIIKAIFPSASITGAPKIRTMQIISELEKSPRKIYTGTIGLLCPDSSAVFNVAIRTILVKGNSGEMGTGGGIVYDSKPVKEYRECLLKSVFLASACKKMQLIETMRWTEKEGYFLLDLHLKRLEKSAEFFRFEYNRRKIIKLLEKTALDFDSNSTYRVRLLLLQNGSTTITFQKIILQYSEKQKTFISKTKIDSKNIFLYHKTTLRDIYDTSYKKAVKKGYFDVIFKNEYEQITEGTITNIFVEKNGILYTPPVSCGLLPGVFRQFLIENKQAIEKVLTEKDLSYADKIYLGNSVRGLVEVELII